MKCRECGSYAINHHLHGRDGSDPDLCDVCYWRKRAESRQNETVQRPAQGSVLTIFGTDRYRVEKTWRGFWPYCVKAGDGQRELYLGHKKTCDRVAAELATAFEDGKFVANLHNQAQLDRLAE